MAVRIKRISINREGPLGEDFLMEPGDLNLIYGHNESGKTFLVEAMISMLFRTGRNTPWISSWTKKQSPTMRKWDYRGEITVSGLEDDDSVFNVGSRKIDDFDRSVTGLPEDLSRIMVVRGGETRLTRSRDGVGDELLRNYLSGNSVLDQVESNISQETVKSAAIEKGSIQAEQRGLVDDRLRILHELEYLESLGMEVEENASLARLNSLEKSKEKLSDRLGEYEKARRHEAFQLSEKTGRLKLRLEKLPTEKDLVTLGTEIGLYRGRTSNLEEVNQRINDLSGDEDDYRWMAKAAEEYDSGLSGGSSVLGKLPLVLMAVFIPAMVAGGFFSRTLMIVSAACAVISLVLLILKGRTSAVSPLVLKRQSRLEEQFRERFGREFPDAATFRVIQQDLEARHLACISAGDERDRLAGETERMRNSINSRLFGITGREVPESEWDGMIDELREERKSVQESLMKTSAILSSLNVSPDSYLSDPPREKWDQKEYLDLRDELRSISEALDNEASSIETLKTDISVATGVNSRDIRELITALEEKTAETKASYREITARILAENRVYAAICECRSLENARLSQALESSEVINPLLEITGRYNGIRITDGGYLRLKTKDGGEFPLERLSTGAAEQVYMALRTGFAELAMGTRAFLLLDDAFQHSDWKRRKYLVDNVVGLVRDGWQVFYFTMDDHLQKLFDKAGRELGRTFVHVTLG